MDYFLYFSSIIASFARESRCYLSGALEGEVDVGTDVLLTEHRVEAGLVEHGLNSRIDA